MATPSSSPRRLSRVRPRSTFERPLQPVPAVPAPPPLAPTTRRSARAQSSPPQHVLAPTAPLGESIFQSLSFGPFTPPPLSPRSPLRATMLANVLESPAPLGPVASTSQPPTHPPRTLAAPRRATNPDAARPKGFPPSPHPADAHGPHRSPPLAFGDAHPRKATLRLSRLRSSSIHERLPIPDPPPDAVPDGPRPIPIGPAARGQASIRRATKDGECTGDDRECTARNGRTRGIRPRASSEFARSALPATSESDEPRRAAAARPRHLELRQALPGSRDPRLSPAPPASSGLHSTRSAKSPQSALADDSDVDADAPTTPSATRHDCLGSPTAPPSRTDRTVTTPTGPYSTSDPASRAQAREMADRRRRDEAQRERDERARHARFFKLKGPDKERCHAFSAEAAPYPLSYSPKVLNHHFLDYQLSRRMGGGLISVHALEKPPSKVLDLGCGTGDWVILAARAWLDTQFVGFDLVPIQPNLERVTHRTGVAIGTNEPDLRLHQRIQWVHGNFLERLPFEDGEFDYVRCRKIARGVPESKWDPLYEEIVRVMKPGAAFEHFEEDLIFPTEIPSKPTQSPLAAYPTPLPNRGLPAPPNFSSSPSLAGTRSSIRPPNHYRRSPSTSFSSVPESPIEGWSGIPSTTSMTGSYAPGSSTSSQPNSSTGPTLAPAGPHSTAAPNLDVDTSPAAKDTRISRDSVKYAPEPMPVPDLSYYDPRVHAQLEELFISMHDARWINLKPLSLIPRLIQEHFAKSITSPPFNLNLPPRPRDGTIQSRVYTGADIRRASRDPFVRRFASEQADPALHAEPPEDEEIRQYISFDFLRIGVSRAHQSPPTLASSFRFDVADMPMHLSCAASDIVACKEAMWEHLKEKDPKFPRRDYDAMIRQYQTDMQDRAGMSTSLRQKLGWGPSESEFMRTPDQRIFEDNYGRAVALDKADPTSVPRPPGLMRCVRTFIARKAAE